MRQQNAILHPDPLHITRAQLYNIEDPSMRGRANDMLYQIQVLFLEAREETDGLAGTRRPKMGVVIDVLVRPVLIESPGSRTKLTTNIYFY